MHNTTVKGIHRFSPRHLAQLWVPTRRALAMAALLCLSTQASSLPSIGPVQAESPLPHVCRVYHIDPNSEKRILILFWTGSTAEMQVEGRRTVFSVIEAACHPNCVAPGHQGVRRFGFQANGIRASFRKVVNCQRDAESCGGLPEGAAELRVSSLSGTTFLRVYNAYCDI